MIGDIAHVCNRGVEKRQIFIDKKTGAIHAQTGTEDLDWCERVQKGKYLEKAGFPKFQKMKYPFLVDTRIFVKHVDPSGAMWPQAVPARYISDDKNYKGKDITD